MLYDKDEFKKQIDEWIRIFRTNGPLPLATRSAQPKRSGAKKQSRGSKETQP